MSQLAYYASFRMWFSKPNRSICAGDHTHRLNAYIKKKTYILMIIFHKIMFLKRIWENQYDIFFQMQITFIWDVSYIINHIHRCQAVKWYHSFYFVESSDDLCINKILTWDKQRKVICLPFLTELEKLQDFVLVRTQTSYTFLSEPLDLFLV